MYIVGEGDTSVTLYVKLRDSSTGFAKTGLAWNSGGAFASYVRPKAAKIDITLATQTVTGAWSSGGFVEVDATAAPGLYRLDPPDGAFAIGVGYSLINIGFTGVLTETVEVILDAYPDVVRGTVQADAGNLATTFKTNLTSAVDNYYKYGWWVFRSGSLSGQIREVTGYVGATKFLVFANGFTAAPNTSDIGLFINR